MLQLDIRDRRTGKTYDLIQESARTGYYILVANDTRGQHVFNQAREMGLHIPLPLTVEEVKKYRLNREEFPKLLIDDLDAVLPTLLGTEVGTCTISSNFIKEKQTDETNEGL